jgi:hypothetical protein
VLEECITEEQRSIVLVMWAKGLNAKDIHKEMFRVYCKNCLSRKEVHNWVEKFSQGSSKVADGARPGVEMAATTIKRFPCFKNINSTSIYLGVDGKHLVGFWKFADDSAVHF